MDRHRSRPVALALALAFGFALGDATSVLAQVAGGPGGPSQGALPRGMIAAGSPDCIVEPFVFTDLGRMVSTSGLTWNKVTVQSGTKSVARAAVDPVAAAGSAGPSKNPQGCLFSAKGGAVPQGVMALDRDIYTTTDFYADRKLWTDPRYFRCSSPSGIESVTGAYGWALMPAGTPKKDAPWGFCDRDYPRDQIVSPYPFKTAQAQYEALMAEAKSRGGPTKYTYEKPPPNWNGAYIPNSFPGRPGGDWISGRSMQITTYLSLLTPQYQQHMVQQMYHDAGNELQWPGAYCWPEGFLRRWFSPGRYVIMSPNMVQVSSYISETLMTQIQIGRDFNMTGTVPNLQGDVRQWFGNTVGFWDGDILVTWTSNIHHWIYHGGLEFSDQMQSVEIYTPITRNDTGKFVGIHHETILYDPEALVEPVRLIEYWEKTQELNEGYPFDWRKCNQTLFPINGLQTPVAVGATIQYTLPNMSGRPWADVWEASEEKMPSRPKSDRNDVPGFN